MDDVSPGKGLQVWIIVEVFTGNDVVDCGGSRLHMAQSVLQAFQVVDVSLVLNLILVQSRPDGCGEGASLLAVFLGVLHKLVEVVGQGRDVPIKNVAEVFLAMLVVVVQPGDNGRDNKDGRNVVALSNFHDHGLLFLW